MAEVRKGLNSILESAERQGGDFKPFCPELRWADGDEKIILILTDLEEIQEYLVHEWIETGKHENANGEMKPDFGFFLSRKDPSIGEKYDDIEDRLEQSPRKRYIGVAVELDPVTEKVGGKTKVVGLKVATDVYEAKNEDEELEDVEYPVIGIVSLSSSNFWGWPANFQNKHGSINEVPLEVTRSGGDKDTSYNFVHMTGTEVDLSDLFETIEGVSYIRETDDFQEMLNEAGEVETNDEDAIPGLSAAQVIADYLLATRIEELSDAERYRTLVSPIEEIVSKFGNKKGKGKGKTTRKTGSSRASSRSKKPTEDVDTSSEDSAPTEAAPEAGDGGSFKNLRARARKTAEEAKNE